MARRDSGRQSAFTMLELLVVVAMIGGIMAATYGVLFGTLDGKRMVDLKVQGARIGPTILDQIERDLRRFYAANLDPNKAFVGKNHSVQGKQADKFHFVSYTPSTMRVETKQKTVFSAVNEIGYVLSESRNVDGSINPEFLTLWRREDFFVDEEPLEDGGAVPLYRRVVGFDVKYFDKRGKDAREEDKWDSEDADQGSLPAAMQITIEYEVEPRPSGDRMSQEELQRRTFVARRFITFTDDASTAMAIRSAVPTAPEGVDNGAPGGPGSNPDNSSNLDGGPSMGLGGGGGKGAVGGGNR